MLHDIAQDVDGHARAGVGHVDVKHRAVEGGVSVHVAAGLLHLLFAAPHAAALCAAGLTPPDLADFVQRAAKAAARNARDRDHLLTQLATLRQLCIAAATTGGRDDGSRTME